MIRPLYRHPGMPLQRWLADPARNDGDSVDGVPGDCLRTALAGALGRERDDVPHFVGLPDRGAAWFWELQRWAREEYDRTVYTWAPDVWLERHAAGTAPYYPGGGEWVVVSGPSPRGPWYHACVADLDLNIVHDPHPLGMGLSRIDTVDVFTGTDGWEPPDRLALTARAA